MRTINRSLLFSLFLSLLFVCGMTSVAKAVSVRPPVVVRAERKSTEGRSHSSNPNILFISVDDMNDWKALRVGGGEGKLELYNLKSDIGEKKDLSEQYQDVLESMKEILDSL